MDNMQWIRAAKLKIEQLSEGTIFEVKQLFEEVEWNTLSKGEKITFGKVFAGEVRERKIKNVVATEKGGNNHSRYKKTKKE